MEKNGREIQNKSFDLELEKITISSLASYRYYI